MLLMCVFCFFNKSFSTSLKSVFSENCFTCRYIFDVFLGAGGLHVLLIHHLVLHQPSPGEIRVDIIIFLQMKTLGLEEHKLAYYHIISKQQSCN